MKKSKLKLGLRLENSNYAEVVVRWLIVDESLSSLAISNRLSSEFGFKIASPTVSGWKKNYYPKRLKRIQSEIVSDPQNESFNISSYLQFLEAELLVVKSKLDKLRRIQEANFNADPPRIDRALERIILEYSKFRIEIFKKVALILSSPQYITSMERLLSDCSELAISVFLEPRKQNEETKEFEMRELNETEKAKANEFVEGLKAIYLKYVGQKCDQNESD
jgi:hypothetical protein